MALQQNKRTSIGALPPPAVFATRQPLLGNPPMLFIPRCSSSLVCQPKIRGNGPSFQEIRILLLNWVTRREEKVLVCWLRTYTMLRSQKSEVSKCVYVHVINQIQGFFYSVVSYLGLHCSVPRCVHSVYDTNQILPQLSQIF